MTMGGARVGRPMTDETENLILHRAREIRPTLAGRGRAFGRLDRRLTAIMGHMQDMKARGGGLPIRPIAAYLPVERRLDRQDDRLRRLENRVAELEQRE